MIRQVIQSFIILYITKTLLGYYPSRVCYMNLVNLVNLVWLENLGKSNINE